MARPIALVDCNNFDASCERLFQLQLRGLPIVVLSNNDGCAIARSNEAKALGFKMGGRRGAKLRGGGPGRTKFRHVAGATAVR